MFTSTKFPPGTNISIVLKVWTTDGPDPVEAWSAPVPKKDIAAIFGRSEWEDPPTAPTAGAHATKPHVQSANYDVSRFFVSQGWNTANVEEALGECSLFYANTHSTDIKFQTDVDEQFVWAMAPYGNPNVLALRTAAIGSGLPPFNSTERPPITIAFLDSCLAGSSHHFSTGFLFPLQNAFSQPQIENQAFVGWVFLVASPSPRDSTTVFWNRLMLGQTVGQATTAMVKDWLRSLGFEPDADPNFNPEDYAKVYGDEYTRLAAVYNGLSNPPTRQFWWRSIQ